MKSTLCVCVCVCCRYHCGVRCVLWHLMLWLVQYIVSVGTFGSMINKSHSTRRLVLLSRVLVHCVCI